MMENHETRSLMNELQTLREEFRQIACFIRELKRDYSVLEEKIELSRVSPKTQLQTYFS